MADDSSADRDPVEELAEEFLERRRRGETPSLKEYTDRYPDLADEIRDVFPALVMMEEVDPASEDLSRSEADARRDTESHPVRQLGDYRILREVGRGGMGIVYEAEQLSLGRRVALKVLPQQMLLDKKHKRRFEREAKAAAKLHHTNIVPVFGVGEQDELHYYVMQFIQGLGLDEVISELQQMREVSQAGRGSSQAELRVSRRGGDLSAARVARSLMTGEFEQTVVTNQEEAAEIGPGRLESTVGYDPQGNRASAMHPAARLEVQQSGAGPLDLALESSGLKDPSSSRLSDSFTLSGPFSLPGQSDTSGSTSGSRARRKQTFWTSVAHIGQQVASALQYAHEQGITHRDIKPSNLLLDMQGTVWVTDFGLAKASDQQDITHTGDILGTLRYMPPEAFEGKSDARGDQYSLGLTLYELLTQKPAFGEKDRHKLIKLVTTSEPQRIEKLNPDVPRDLATIVHKAIDRDPLRRYASARDLVDDLQRFRDDEPIRARRISTAERLARWSRHNKGLAASLAVVCMLLLLINIAGPVMTWQLNVARQKAAEEAARNKSLADRQTVLAEAAEAARRESLTALADLETERGFLAARDHGPAEAALWFARAAGETPHDPHREAMNGLRARNWLNRAYLPVASFVLEKRGLPRKVEFQPNGHCLLTLHTTGAEIWDWWAEHALEWSQGLSGVVDACWSPDGRWVALAFASGETQIRDALSGYTRETLRHPAGVHAIAWSPDGHRLAAAVGTKVDVWNLDGESKLEHFWPHPAPVHSIVFDGSGDRLATACDDGQVRVYAVVGGGRGKEPQFSPLPHLAWRMGMEGPVFKPPVFVDSDRAMITVTPDRRLGWWNTATGADVTPKSHESTDNPVGRLFGSRDGDWFGVRGFDGAFRFEVGNIDGRTFAVPHSNAVQDVEFLPGNTAVVTTCWNGSARVWSLPPGRDPLLTIPQMEAIVLVAASSDGALALCGSGYLCVWRQTLLDAPLAQVGDWSAPHRRPRIGFDGRFATPGVWHESPDYWATGGNMLSVLQVDNVQPAGPDMTLPGQFWDSCLCADNRTVAVACLDGATGAIGFHDIATGTAILPAIALPSPPQSIAARPGRPHVAVLCQDGTVQVFEHEHGTLLNNLNDGSSCRLKCSRIAWSPDGSALVTLNDRQQIVVRNAETGEMRYPPILAGEGCRFFTLAFSEDGQWLATAVNGDRHDVQVWDMTTGRPAGPPLGHPGAGDAWGIFAITFSPDGRLLLSGDKDGRARLWDWRSGVLQCPPMGHADEVYDVAITEDGRFALTAVRKGMVHLWDLVSGKPVAPPLSLPTPGAETLARVGDRVIVGSPRYPLFSLAPLLSDPDMPIGALQTNAELACGRKMQLGELTPLEQSDWTERWAAFHQSGSSYTALIDSLAQQMDAASDAGARRIIARRARQLGVLERLADLRPQVLALQLVLFQELSQIGGAATSVRRDEIAARLIDARLPDEAATASELASLILNREASNWVSPAPVELSATGGTLLTGQPDGSILVSGENPGADEYTVVLPATEAPVTAVRLDLLADAPLAQGSDAAARGRFMLADISVTLRTAAGPSVETPLTISRPASDVLGRSGRGTGSIGYLLDGNPATRWNPESGQNHFAVFELASPSEAAGGDRQLVVRLATGSGRAAAQGLRRFRLSISSDPAAFGTEQSRLTARQIGDPWLQLGAAYLLNGSRFKAAESFARALGQEKSPTRERQLIEQIAALGMDVAELVQSRPRDPVLLAALASEQAARGEPTQSAASLVRARDLAEVRLATDGDAERAATALAEVLLAAADVNWTVLRPGLAATASDGGATLHGLPDGSILVSGENPVEDQYTLTFPAPQPGIAAIRLETIVDERLPFAGSGRSPINGNFHVGEVSFGLKPAEDAEEEIPLVVARAFADVAGSESRGIENVCDRDRGTIWTPYPHQTENHVAVFEIAPPPAGAGGEKFVVIRIDTGSSPWGQHGIGRFRLSAATSANAVETERLRLAISKSPLSGWTRLAAAYRMLGEQEAMNRALARAHHSASPSASRATQPLQDQIEVAWLLSQCGETETALAAVRDALRPMPVTEITDDCVQLLWESVSVMPSDDPEVIGLLAQTTQLLLLADRRVELQRLMADRQLAPRFDGKEFELELESIVAAETPVVRQQVWVGENRGNWTLRVEAPELIESRQRQVSTSGYRPASLVASERSHAAQPILIALWTKDSNPYRVEFSLTRSRYEQLLDEVPRAMRLASVDDYQLAGETRYAVLWHQQPGAPPWELHERLSVSATTELADRITPLGFRPTFVNPHRDGTLTTVWVNDGHRGELLLNLACRDLIRLEAELPANRRPVWIDSHFDGQCRRYCVIVEETAQAVEWKFGILVPQQLAQRDFERHTRSGWMPIATTESAVGKLRDDDG